MEEEKVEIGQSCIEIVSANWRRACLASSKAEAHRETVFGQS